MKLINRDTDYAIRALCYLAKRTKEIVSVSELVKKLNIPRPFLRKILQILNKNRLLTSYKGAGGGFSLAKPAEKIFLPDLVKIFQGELKLNECIFKKRICPSVKICPLKEKLDTIELYVVKELKSINLASLLKKEGKSYG